MSILKRASAWLADRGVSLTAQNLNKQPGPGRYGSILAHGRAWLRKLKPHRDDYERGGVDLEWSHGKRAGWGGAEIWLNPEDEAVTLSFGVPGAQYYVTLRGVPGLLFELLPMNLHRPGRSLPRRRKCGVRLFDGAIWIALWADDMEWRSSDPKWMSGVRIGLDDIADVVFGKVQHTTELLEERDVLIPMPERAYPATAQITIGRWARPRWPWAPFSKERVGSQIDIPGGIPTDHKGPLYAISMPETSIAKAVGHLVGDVYRSRGGFERPASAPTEA